MNKNIISIGQNQYQVVNEKGETSFTVANKEGSKEILIKENELESFFKQLNLDKEKLQSNSVKNIFANITMIGMMSVMFIIAVNCTTFPIATLLTLVAYCPYKVLHCMAFGTRSKRKREKKKLTREIEKLEINIPVLEKNIISLKKDIEFKKYCIKNKNSNENTVTIVSNYAYSTDEEIKDENPKVLSMGTKNRMK